MKPVAITIENTKDNKNQTQVKILNLNQKQLNQNRLRHSRNPLLPTQNKNKNNTYLKNIYNSKEEELTKGVQLSGQPIAPTATSHK